MEHARETSWHVDQTGWSRVTTLMFVACGLYWLCDAVELGLMSYLVAELRVAWTLPKPVSDSIASIVFGGIVIGALTFGVLSDKIGRRKVFLITAAGTGIFGIASAFSPEIVCMLVLRFCCGVFLGGGPAAYSLYLEFLPRQYAWVMTFFNLWFTLGTLIEAVLAYLVLTSLGWRWLVGLSSLPILLLSVAFPFIRESPQYLSGDAARKPELLTMLDTLYAYGGKKREHDVAIVETRRGNVRDLFAPDLIRRTILFCLIWFCTNLVFYGVSFFAVNYFLQVFPENESAGLLILIVVSSGEVVGALVASLLVSRQVRRFLVCCILLSVCSLFLLLLLVTENIYARMMFSLVSRACIFGSFATIYLWTPLVVPTNVRTSAMGLVSSFGKIASIIAPFISSSFEKTDVVIPSVLFGCASALCAILVCFVGVEPEKLAEKVSDDETTPLIK